MSRAVAHVCALRGRYDKPTARVKEQERPLGFVLERTLNFTFPCFAMVRAASLARWCARYLLSGSALKARAYRDSSAVSMPAPPATLTHP